MTLTHGDVLVSLAWVLRTYRPGRAHTWDMERAALLTFPCLCTPGQPFAPPADMPCPTPGHYQRKLEAHLASVGAVTQGVLLGRDGRVWDGNHRIVAARALGFDTIPVEPWSVIL